MVADPPQALREKQVLLLRLERMRLDGHKLTRCFNLNDDPEDMHYELMLLERRQRIAEERSHPMSNVIILVRCLRELFDQMKRAVGDPHGPAREGKDGDSLAAMLGAFGGGGGGGDDDATASSSSSARSSGDVLVAALLSALRVE